MRIVNSQVVLVAILTVVVWPLAGQSFAEVARDIGIRHVCIDANRIGGGAAFFDYDGDGLEDLYLTGCQEPDRLYANKGNGEFRDATKDAGLEFLEDIYTVGVATADIDNDGDRDVYVTTAEHFPDVLLLNNGDGTFTNIAEQAGITETDWSTAVTFGDYNLDGWLDIYVGNYATYDALPYDENLTGGIENLLYRNNQDGTFTDVAQKLGVQDINGATLAATFTDFDGDADLDLHVGNDFGFLFEPNALYRNEYPEDQFTDISEPAAIDTAINAMGYAIGDFDTDGDLDYYVTNMAGNVFYRNDGGGVFSEHGRSMGIDDENLTSWGAAFLDFDHDTDLDLFVANGRVLSKYDMTKVDHIDRFLESHINKLYRNDHTTFTDISHAEGVADSTRGRGLAYSDYDNDGDLDVVIAGLKHRDEANDRALFYRNTRDDLGNWLKVSLQGVTSNRDGFGSLVRVFEDERVWIREIGGGTSYLSQNSTVAHFGLAELMVVDSVVVTWPGGTRHDTITNVSANQTLKVIEGTSSSIKTGSPPHP